MVSARRVDASGRWDFFWACDSDGKAMMLLKYPSDAAPRSHLPRLRGIEISLHDPDVGTSPSLVLRLRDDSLREPFHRLCLDIIDCAESAQSAQEAVASAVARTWHWHHLLRGGTSNTLTLEQQKGLIGELLVLEQFLLPHLAPMTALNAWRGPLGAPQDFVVGKVAVESKVHSAVNAGSVQVSSEFQLDTTEWHALFLHTTRLVPADPSDDVSFSLKEVVERVRSYVLKRDASSVWKLNALLLASGLRSDADYSIAKWKGDGSAIYKVGDSFPRIVPSNMPAGVSGVRYSVDLSFCASDLVDGGVLTSTLSGALSEF